MRTTRANRKTLKVISERELWAVVNKASSPHGILLLDAAMDLFAEVKQHPQRYGYARVTKEQPASWYQRLREMLLLCDTRMKGLEEQLKHRNQQIADGD